MLTGSTSSAMPWPKEHIPKELSEDERLEKMMKKFQPLGADPFPIQNPPGKT